jgi:hypothetical protein
MGGNGGGGSLKDIQQHLRHGSITTTTAPSYPSEQVQSG